MQITSPTVNMNCYLFALLLPFLCVKARPSSSGNLTSTPPLVHHVNETSSLHENRAKPEIQVCQAEKMCQSSCVGNSSQVCHQECLSGNCDLQCQGKKVCQQHCKGNSVCTEGRVYESEECVQMCTDFASCETMFCYQCKRCKQIFSHILQGNDSQIQRAICTHEVPFCDIYVYRRSLMAFVGGEITNFTSGNSYTIIRTLKGLRTLNVNCTGTEAACAVSYDPRYPIEINNVCKENCSMFHTLPLIINIDGHYGDEEQSISNRNKTVSGPKANETDYILKINETYNIPKSKDINTTSGIQRTSTIPGGNKMSNISAGVEIGGQENTTQTQIVIQPVSASFQLCQPTYHLIYLAALAIAFHITSM